MQNDKDDINEVIIEVLMKELVEREGLPRERVQRGVQRFLEALRQEPEGSAIQRFRDMRERSGRSKKGR
jgi:hypothetical protein